MALRIPALGAPVDRDVHRLLTVRGYAMTTMDVARTLGVARSVAIGALGRLEGYRLVRSRRVSRPRDGRLPSRVVLTWWAV